MRRAAVGLSAAAAAVVRGRDLDLELLDPGSEPLVRLYRHAEGDWEPPPEQHRNLRVDPPRGRQGAYAVLYTANTLPAAAAECRVLNVDGMDRYTWARDRARTPVSQQLVGTVATIAYQ